MTVATDTATYTSCFYQFTERPLADSCWSLQAGPDGRIYAAACIEHTGGQSVTVLRYNESKDQLEYLFDMDRVSGDLRDSGRATQCKIHYSFAPSPETGMLYAATHVSGPPVNEKYYHTLGDWHDDRRAFQGAYLAAYDTSAEEIAWCRLMIPKEGCRCICLDEQRGRLYALTYPRDHFVYYDLHTGDLHDVGRIGSVNSQCLFADSHGRIHFTDDWGRFLRYEPDTDRIRSLPHIFPHEWFQNGWHGVLYDAVASPEGDCIYMVPWMVRPHLVRFYPEDGTYGRVEDLGKLTQSADVSTPVSMSLDHVGGLVFGPDGYLYWARAVWPDRPAGKHTSLRSEETRAIVTRMNPATLQQEDVCTLQRSGTGAGYISRDARDHAGNLYFGHVGEPPVGFFRVSVPVAQSGENAHLPLRMWG